MFRVETHKIRKGDESYNECNEICNKSFVLYNDIHPYLSEYYDKTHKVMGMKDVFSIAKHFESFKKLPYRVSNQTIFKAIDNWTAFKGANKSFYKDSSKFKAKPEPPKLLKRDKYIAIYEKTAINKKGLKYGYLRLSNTNIKVYTKIDFDKIREIRVVPKPNWYNIEVVYKKENTNIPKLNTEEIKTINKYIATKDIDLLGDIPNIASIDLGVDNLATLSFNNDNRHESYIINGKSIKSINQYFNKNLSKAKSELPKNVKTSKKIIKLYEKRDNKLTTLFHSISKYIVNLLVEKDVKVLVLGYNKNWKQNINLGKATNQKFTSIPFSKLKMYLMYKCDEKGIMFAETEESYTSKCSFLDDETVEFHQEYKGNRIKRGLFKSSEGVLINADLNGSYNIMRKVFPNAFADGIEGVSVHPKRVNLN